MTDFLAMSAWILMSSLVRQVDSGIDEERDENEAGSGGADLGTGGVEAEPFEPIEQAIKIAIVAFSLLLLGLSISAYRKTALKRILYASVAFGLFAVQMFFDYLEDVVKGFDAPFNDIIFTGITLAILALFFMAVVRKT